MNTTFNLYSFFVFVALCFAVYVFVWKYPFQQLEGMTNNTATSASTTNGMAGGAAAYGANIKAETIKLQDMLLISKYRTDYETVILNLDDYLNNVMLQTVLQMDVSNPQNAQQNITKLANLSQTKTALNSIMKFKHKETQRNTKKHKETQRNTKKHKETTKNSAKQFLVAFSKKAISKKNECVGNLKRKDIRINENEKGEGDTGVSLIYYCRQCENTEEQLEPTCIARFSKDNLKKDADFNKFSKLDPTLPRIATLHCPNEQCTGIAQKKPSEVIYIRTDELNMKYKYMCVHCDTVWSL